MISQNSNAPTISALYYYPIKSCAGTSVASLDADELGPANDRRFMLVDEDSIFLSQRETPKLSLVEPQISGDDLFVDAPEMPRLEIPQRFLQPSGGESQARVWRDIVRVQNVSGEADAWFSAFLGVRCWLVHLPGDSIRPVDPDFGAPNDRVTLADGFPFLAISEASLKDLNSRLEKPLPMNRFRPNIVIGGTEAYEEDSWGRLRIGESTGGMEFRAVKACARCAITTVDQSTANRGKEPLTTLATYRNSPEGVLFGQNLIHDGPGTVKVGDVVEAAGSY